MRPLNTALVLAGLLMAPGIAQHRLECRAPAELVYRRQLDRQRTHQKRPLDYLTIAGDQATKPWHGAKQQGAGTAWRSCRRAAALPVSRSDIIVAGDNRRRRCRQAHHPEGAARCLPDTFSQAMRPGRVLRLVTGAGSTLTRVAPTRGGRQGTALRSGATAQVSCSIDAGANVTINGTRTLHVGDTANGTLSIGSGAGAGTLTADSVILGTAGSSVQFNHSGTTTFVSGCIRHRHPDQNRKRHHHSCGKKRHRQRHAVNGGHCRATPPACKAHILNNANVNFQPGPPSRHLRRARSPAPAHW